ncbi:MAG: CHAP domain-containing protein [Candidatus Saccharibacteria bacterium]
MNITKNKLQQGFAVIELAIFVVVITAISGIGYWAVSKSKAAVTANSDIASITPSSGPIGTQIKFKPKTKYAGHYAVNVKKVGGDSWRTNVVRLKASSDGQSLTKEDDTFWTFPAYPCTRDSSGTPEAICAASAAADDNSGFKAFPNSSWYISLTDSTNATGNPITGNTDKMFSVTELATPTAIVSPTPTTINDVHPSISGISPQIAKLGQTITINKGTTKFKSGRYLIYFHLPNDAANKIPIGDIQNSDATGSTLTFVLPTDNAAIQYSSDTLGSLQVKDSDNLYSNSYVFTIKAETVTSTPMPTSTPSPTSSTTPLPAATAKPTITVTPNPTYSPDIGSISPISGPIGTKLKINAAKKFSGHYQLNLKQVGGNLFRANVVRLKATDDGKSLTNEDGSLWIFPAYPCARDASGKPDAVCANSAVTDDGSGFKAVPGSKWDLSLTDANNPTGTPITGTKTARFTVTDPASVTPSPGVSPTPVVTPTPSQPWYCRYFKLYCPATPTPTPSPTPSPTPRTTTPTPSPSPTPKPEQGKSILCTITFGLLGCDEAEPASVDPLASSGKEMSTSSLDKICSDILNDSNLKAGFKNNMRYFACKQVFNRTKDADGNPTNCEVDQTEGNKGEYKYNNKTIHNALYAYQTSSNLKWKCKNQPWCAAFASYIHHQAFNGSKYDKSGSCNVGELKDQYPNQSHTINRYASTPIVPKPGDIVGYDYGPNRGHVGVLVDIKGGIDGDYYTVEGNGGGKQCVRVYKKSLSDWQFFINSPNTVN